MAAAVLPHILWLLQYYLTYYGCCSITLHTMAAAVLPYIPWLLQCYLTYHGCCSVTLHDMAAAVLPYMTCASVQLTLIGMCEDLHQRLLQRWLHAVPDSLLNTNSTRLHQSHAGKL